MKPNSSLRAHGAARSGVRAHGAAARTVQQFLPRPLQGAAIRMCLAVRPAAQESSTHASALRTCSPARDSNKLPPATSLAAAGQPSTSRVGVPLPSASTELLLAEEPTSRIEPASISPEQTACHKAENPEKPVPAIRSLPLPDLPLPAACPNASKAAVLRSRTEEKPEKPTPASLSPPGLPFPGACTKTSKAAVLPPRTQKKQEKPTPASLPLPGLPPSGTSTSASSASTRGSVAPKLRKYFLSDEEKPTAVPFRTFCKSISMTKTGRAPGAKEDSTSTTAGCDRLMRTLMSLFSRLHNGAKKSLKGKFTIDNLYVTEDGEVKLGGDVKLKRKTKSRANTDLRRLARELRSHVFDEGEPAEISCWLDMMLVTALDRELSVRCPSALMSPWNKLSLFNWLNKRLWTIEQTDKKKYNEILKRIPYAHRWKELAKGNLHLHQAYYSEGDNGKRKSFYSYNARGFLRFVRNAIEHLHEKCLRGSTLLFEEWEVAAIICSTFPLLIGSLQESVELEGELVDHIVQGMMG